MHQLLHVADGLKWLGPMHVYSQWEMERMCGMITRTAKSRVDANRNMEITLLLTEQKHMLGYVLNEIDWPTKEDYDSDEDSSDEEPDNAVEGIDNRDGDLSLLDVFAHRLGLSRPEPVRESISTPRQRYEFIGRVRSRNPEDIERRRIRKFMSGLQNYDKDLMSVPTQISIWRWCRFRDKHDNKKVDFKVTSRVHKRANNTRNSSVVSFRSSDGQREFAEVQFFFLTRLPSELGSDHPGDSDNDSEGDNSGTALYHLAFVRKITFEHEAGGLVRVVKKAGSQAVIAVDTIESLIGSLKVQNDEYLTMRFTSMLGRMK